MPIVTLRNSFDDEKVKALRDITYAETGVKGPLITKGLPPVGNSPAAQFGPFDDGPKTTQVSARLDDASRIAQIIAKNPKFMINQGLLKPVPKPNPGQGLLGQIATQVGSRILNTGKTVASTLAQVPVNGTGTHFVYSFGGFEYVKDNPRTPSTALGQFLQTNLGIGSGGVKGAGIALSGGTIIPDNEGQADYGPVSTSNLTEYNSKYDIKDGATDFSILRPDLQNVFSLVKGLLGGGKSTPVSPDNQGQEGFRTMREGELEYSSDYDLDGDPDTYLDREGGITDFTGQETYTQQVESEVEKQDSEFKLSEDPETYTKTGDENNESIHDGSGFSQDPEKTYTGRDGRLNTATSGVGSNLTAGDKKIGEDVSRTYLRLDTKGITRYSNRTAARSLDPTKRFNINENDGNNQSGPISVHQMPGQYGGADTEAQSTARTLLAPTETNELEFAKYTIFKLDKSSGESWKTADSRLDNRMDNNAIDKIAASTSELLGKDIIPFSFHVREPSSERFLHFKAYLESLSDNFQGDWQGNKYVGRAEEFFTYNGFSRTLSFGFKAAALSKQDLIPMYEKLNYLAGVTAPTYDSNGQFMRGTLVTMRIGEYLDQVTGFISSVSLEWSTEYPWEIDLYDENIPVVPHLLDVSCEFTPIHDFNPKADLDQTSEVYFGPKQTPPAPKEPEKEEDKKAVEPNDGEVEYFYTSGMTYTIDKKTKKVIEVNGQPTKYTNGGFAYQEDGRQAVITKVNGSNATIFEDADGNPVPVNDQGEPIEQISTVMLDEVVITASKPTETDSSATQVVNTDSQSPAVPKTTQVEQVEVTEGTDDLPKTTKTTIVKKAVYDGRDWTKVNETAVEGGRDLKEGQIKVTVTLRHNETGREVSGVAIGTIQRVVSSAAMFNAQKKAVGL